MKRILLFIFFLISISLVNGALIKANLKARGMINENSLLTIDFYGSCYQFDKLVATMKVHSLSGCLPIGAEDDIDVEFVCQPIKNKVARITFTESNTLTNPAFSHDDPFVLSFVPNTYFKASSLTYQKQPKCFSIDSPCGLPSMIHKCADEGVEFHRVKTDLVSPSKERIFITSNGAAAPGTCKDGVNKTCCPYITASDGGICEKDQNAFEFKL